MLLFFKKTKTAFLQSVIFIIIIYSLKKATLSLVVKSATNNGLNCAARANLKHSCFKFHEPAVRRATAGKSPFSTRMKPTPTLNAKMNRARIRIFLEIQGGAGIYYFY